MRWILLVFLAATVGCRSKVDDGGQAGYVPVALAPMAGTEAPLLAAADGLVPPNADAVFVLRSLGAVLKTLGLAAVLERPSGWPAWR
ncbi:MAG: hypothetical protein R3F43_07710 [bacterium]